MKFKVGDKVKVVRRTDIFTDEMERYIGTVHTVKKTEKFSDGDAYFLDGCTHYVFNEEALEFASGNKIVITVNGDKTTATMYDGKKVIETAVAKCSQSDEFDFKTGAELAFKRLMGKSKTKFLPHLILGNVLFGVIGTPTNYKDVVGRPLAIGDVVELFDEEGFSYGQYPIVRCFVESLEREKTFVMGIESDCDDIDGSIIRGWKVIKTRSYDEIKNNEEYGLVAYIKEV
jgi:hypothetical protein